MSVLNRLSDKTQQYIGIDFHCLYLAVDLEVFSSDTEEPKTGIEQLAAIEGFISQTQSQSVFDDESGDCADELLSNSLCDGECNNEMMKTFSSIIISNEEHNSPNKSCCRSCDCIF